MADVNPDCVLLALGNNQGVASVDGLDPTFVSPSAIWEHVNPYGRFELDMSTRLPLQ